MLKWGYIQANELHQNVKVVDVNPGQNQDHLHSKTIQYMKQWSPEDCTSCSLLFTYLLLVSCISSFTHHDEKENLQYRGSKHSSIEQPETWISTAHSGNHEWHSLQFSVVATGALQCMTTITCYYTYLMQVPKSRFNYTSVPSSLWTDSNWRKSLYFHPHAPWHYIPCLARHFRIEITCKRHAASVVRFFFSQWTRQYRILIWGGWW